LEIKNRIHTAINGMPPEKLDAVLSFLDDLQKSSEDETARLMSEPGFMSDYLEAREDIRTGKTVSFKTIRRDV